TPWKYETQRQDALPAAFRLEIPHSRFEEVRECDHTHELPPIASLDDREARESRLRHPVHHRPQWFLRMSDDRVLLDRRSEQTVAIHLGRAHQLLQIVPTRNTDERSVSADHRVETLRALVSLGLKEAQ